MDLTRLAKLGNKCIFKQMWSVGMRALLCDHSVFRSQLCHLFRPCPRVSFFLCKIGTLMYLPMRFAGQFTTAVSAVCIWVCGPGMKNGSRHSYWFSESSYGCCLLDSVDDAL